MLGIIGAMDVEVDGLIRLIAQKKSESISGITFTSGTIDDCAVVVAECGVGKVNAAVCAQTMILTYRPDTIINIGVAGSLSETLSVGDIAIADNVVQYDIDTTPCGEPLGFVPGLDRIDIPCSTAVVEQLQQAAKQLKLHHCIGKIVTGDRFVNDAALREFLHRQFCGIACEMEGGSVGHVCYINQIDFCVLRSISDHADGTSNVDFLTFTNQAAENSIRLIRQFIANQKQ